jgi:hypothetical protein
VNVVQLKKPEPVEMKCSACGATAEASCNCGVPYVPAGSRAAKAVAKNPKKSDRAIAAEIGVSGETVRRARRKSGATNVAPERIGKDGKTYMLRKQDHVALWRGREIAGACIVRACNEGRLELYDDGTPLRKVLSDDDPANEAYAGDQKQKAVYDYACLIVDEQMSANTRRKFFARLKRKHDV